MPQFFFRDRDGTVRRIIAADLAQATAKAEEVLGGRWRLAPPRPPVSMAPAERMWLWRQLAALLSDNIPLDRALADISMAAATGGARVAAARLADLCAQGLSLAEAMAAVPGVADEAHQALVAAAEDAGRLPGAVRLLAELAETDANTAAELALRWMYPSAVAILGLFALPLFAVIVRSTLPSIGGQLWLELGLRRQELGLAASVWPCMTALPIVGLVIAATLLVVVFLARFGGPRTQQLVDRLLYAFPGYGAFRFHKRICLFFHALALARSAGVSDPQALAMAREVAGPTLGMLLLPAQGAVEAGMPLPVAISTMEWLPALSRSRLTAAIAQSFADVAGRLAAEHRRLADYYARRFVTIAEPAMVVVVALAVGALALAIFSPLATVVSMLSALTQ